MAAGPNDTSPERLIENLRTRDGADYWDALRRVANDDHATSAALGDLVSANRSDTTVSRAGDAAQSRTRDARARDFLERASELRHANPHLDFGAGRHRLLLDRLVYAVIRPDFELLSTTLEAVLRRAAIPVCSSAIVQARAKNLDSFTEKCARKSDLYRDGVFAAMTDLSAARVVVQTTSQVTRMCKFIEDAFDVDWDHSEDAGLRLGVSEFGYRSHHYVVSIRPDTERLLGVPIEWDRLKGLKAEIQVRTLAQHAVADTLHDRLYKATVTPLPRHEREQARIASILENADRILDNFVTEFDEYALQQSMFSTTSEIETELSVLDIVSAEVDDPWVAMPLLLRQASLLHSLGRVDAVASLLRPFIDLMEGARLGELDPDSHARLLFEYGLALLTRDAEDPDASRYLEEAFSTLSWVAADELAVWIGERRLLVHMLATAGTIGRRADWLARALRIDGDDPYAVAALLELQAVEPATVRSALRPAREHAASRVNEPDVHFVLGRLNLALGQPEEAMRHYSDALLFYRGNDIQRNERVLRLLADEVTFVAKHEGGRAHSIAQMLHLGSGRLTEAAPVTPGTTWVVRDSPLVRSSAGHHPIGVIPAQVDALIEALARGPGTLVLDDDQEELARAALAVGAEVVVTDPDLAARLASDERVRAVHGVRTVPAERETLQALFASRTDLFDESLVEALAEAGHERGALRRITEMREADYRDARGASIPTRSDIGERTATWARLLETYKVSARDRVAYAATLFGFVGLEISPDPLGALTWVDLTPEQREDLGRFEHGRWNAERVRSGWVQLPPRDNARQCHDLIVAWHELTEEVQSYDLEGIADLIADFADHGLYVRAKVD